MKSVAIGLMSLLVLVATGGAEQPFVAGQVRLVDGQPVAGAQVLLFDLADLRRGPVAQATADADGQFALSLGGSGLPQGFALGQNYPNPFNPGTVIPYQLEADGYVRLEVFNLLGQRVATLVDGERAAGSHTAVWTATDASGWAVSAGVYLYRLTVAEGSQTGRMVLVDGQAGLGRTLGSAQLGAWASLRSDERALQAELVEARPPATPSGAYGLVVVGEGVKPYVDPAFRVETGLAAGDLVVEGAVGLPRMKVAARVGDVNGDGQVDVSDALLVMMYLVLLDVSVLDLRDLDWRDRMDVVFFLERYSSLAADLGRVDLGDVDEDGDVDFNDVQFMLTYSINPFDPRLPAGIGFQSGLGLPAVDPGDLLASLPGGAQMAFVRIEPGVFQMGSPSGELGRWDHEGPVHEVEISRGFWLGKYEVTQREWELVMGDNPSWYGRNSRLPVDSVSWYDVHEFIGRLNASAGDSLYRLPSEAEWEYACRAGTQTRWSFGDDSGQLVRYAWYDGNNSPHSTKAVGLRRPNGWGLYDMHGNVWEWVQDWYSDSYYKNSPRVDPQGPSSGSLRVARGGDFDNLARGVRSAYRNGESPNHRNDSGGVRLVRIR